MAGVKDAGLDENTIDVGMVFLHETLHTKAGASYFNSEEDNKAKWGGKSTGWFYDPLKMSNKDTPGGTVDRINQFRKELKLPRRYKYGKDPASVHFELDGTKYDINWSPKPLYKL